ncbi:MAG: DnaA N-terminal domain-containing protein [Planctomycetota bacterium]
MLAILQDVWQRSQPRLKAQVGDAAYAAWLEQLRPLALERSVCYLEATSRMACERVQRLFQPLLENLLSEEIGTRVSVHVLPAPESLVPERLEVGPTQPLVDTGNRTAVLVLGALADPEKVGTLPSLQVLLIGPPGVGKSFLLRWWAGSLARRPLLLVGEEITRTYQAAFRENRAPALTEELALAPHLALDEVHRCGGQPKVQGELVKVLRAREEALRPTVLTSRFHPRDVWKLDPVLESLLMAGFVTQLEYPGLDARLRYLRALEGPAARNGLAQAVEHLAREVHGGYRDLRRLWLAQRAGHGAEVQGRYLQLIEPRVVFDRVLARVCAKLGVESSEVVGRSQARTASFARQAVAHLCVLEGLSRAEVGRFLGRRSRAAISYAIKTLHARMAASETTRKQVEELVS